MSGELADVGSFWEEDEMGQDNSDLNGLLREALKQYEKDIAETRDALCDIKMSLASCKVVLRDAHDPYRASPQERRPVEMCKNKVYDGTGHMVFWSPEGFIERHIPCQRVRPPYALTWFKTTLLRHRTHTTCPVTTRSTSILSVSCEASR